MLKTVDAMIFHGKASHARNEPMLLDVCDPVTGEHSEVFAKFTGNAESKVSALISEAIAAMLAKDLGLPIPEPVLVEIDNQFIDSITDATCLAACKRSLPIGFGSTKLPAGYRSWMKGELVNPSNIQVAANVIAFDAEIQNPDRRPDRPNSLTNGSEIAIIDHDIAFVIEGVLGWQPPWERNSLSYLISPALHVFFNSVKGKPICYNAHTSIWKQKITDGRLQEYGNALPPSWIQNSSRSHEILDYIQKVRNNIDDVAAEVKRVLS